MRRLIGSDGHPPRSSPPQTLGPRFGSGLDVRPIRSGPCRADRDTTYGDAGRRRAFEARARSPQRLSSQLVRHRGDAGHGAFLVAFGTRSLTPSTPIVSLPTDSRLCGFALSACKNTRHRLARSKTATCAVAVRLTLLEGGNGDRQVM